MDKSRTVTVAMIVRVATIVALVVSAYAHLKLAKDYDHPAGGSISQGTLFKIQGVVALLFAIGLAINTRWEIWASALGLLLSSFFAVNFYRYGNLGEFLFLPDMRDKTWTSRDNLKVISAVAEGLGTIVAATGLWMAFNRRVSSRGKHSG